jgi:hypothetical protein
MINAHLLLRLHVGTLRQQCSNHPRVALLRGDEEWGPSVLRRRRALQSAPSPASHQPRARARPPPRTPAVVAAAYTHHESHSHADLRPHASETQGTREARRVISCCAAVHMQSHARTKNSLSLSRFDTHKRTRSPIHAMYTGTQTYFITLTRLQTHTRTSTLYLSFLFPLHTHPTPLTAPGLADETTHSASSHTYNAVARWHTRI